VKYQGIIAAADAVEFMKRFIAGYIKFPFIHTNHKEKLWVKNKNPLKIGQGVDSG
jgi:hypothetical protein